MAAFPYIPRQGRVGGGAALLDAYRSGALGWASPAQDFWWGYKLKVTGSGFWDRARITALAAATSQVITASTTFPGTAFPTNMIVNLVLIRQITPWAGVTAPVLSVGDAGNDDEWVDLFDLTLSARVEEDSADADAVMAVAGCWVVEAGYSPIITLGTSAGNISALTAGETDIMLRCSPLPPALPYGQP